MKRSTKLKVAAGAAAGIAVAAGGGAVAATQLDSPKEESQAVVNDAAQQLGIQPSKLSDALKKALADRVDAAVTAGRLTKAQGDAMKARIQSNDFPIFGGPHGGFGPHEGGPVGLDAAASFLGLTDAQLHTKLESGNTLAQIAKDQGKSVDGLVQTLVADAKKHLDEAVAAGHLTQAQEQSILADAKQRITDLVNGKLPRFGGRPGFGDRPGFGGPPPLGARPASDQAAFAGPYS